MQEFWGLILVLCLAIGCSAVPVKDRDEDLSSNINLPALSMDRNIYYDPPQFRLPRYHPFAALTNFGGNVNSGRSSLLDSELSDQYINSNNLPNPANSIHQKRQTAMRYHQCYFNPISCFRRRR